MLIKDVRKRKIWNNKRVLDEDGVIREKKKKNRKKTKAPVCNEEEWSIRSLLTPPQLHLRLAPSYTMSSYRSTLSIHFMNEPYSFFFSSSFLPPCSRHHQQFLEYMSQYFFFLVFLRLFTMCIINIFFPRRIQFWYTHHRMKRTERSKKKYHLSLSFLLT